MTEMSTLARRAYIDNVWNHWFAGHLAAVGGTCLLDLKPIDPPLETFLGGAELLHRPNRQQRRASRRTVQPRSHRPKAETAGSWQSPELADWAKQLLGGPHNNSYTVEDLLEAVDDYFELFAKLKKYHGPYDYFSRVGTPVVLRNTMAFRDDIDRLKIPNAERLPSMFGSFITRTKDDYRKEIMSEHGGFVDFEYFEKLRKNYATCAPLGTTIFRHNLINLGRAGLSKQELRKFPHAGLWGASWLVGVLPDGTVKALPEHMTLRQRLPNGSSVYHSGMMVPPGLENLCRHGADYYVRILFNVVVAFTASALSGVQVTVKRGSNAFRFGLPITDLRTFFGDRDLEGGQLRRGAILHLRRPHLRTMTDGREITVGEHLSGSRFFTWRGCRITISVPGIHHPAVEGFDVPMITSEDRDYDRLDKRDMVDTARVGEVIAGEVWRRRKSRFKRGQPVLAYKPSPLAGMPDASNGDGNAE